jgi:porphobilinogen synthase
MGFRNTAESHFQSMASSFPRVRLRRNRQHDWLRRLVAEHRLSADDLIEPVFLRFEDDPRDIHTLPGIFRYNLDEVVAHVEKLANLKIPAIHLFPFYPKAKRDNNILAMLTMENIVCQAIERIKKSIPNIGIICDVALDQFSTHGQDGIIRDAQIVNDETVEIISNYAVILAQAGADIIAPSDMMDGRVGAIRTKLDLAGYNNVGIMSYAAKYVSNFYGPFRDSIGSRECLGTADKKTYQLDPANAEEALREVQLDLEEGADSIIVKPGLPYLDILYRVRQTFGVPTFAFHVSGEYALLKFAAEAGIGLYEDMLMETLLAFKRAGATGILTYGATDAATILAHN